MTSDREEIRWKLQNIYELVDSSFHEHQNERNGIKSDSEKFYDSILKLRNNIIAAFGFGIGLWVSLIAIEIIDHNRVWDIIYGIIFAAILFFGINIYLYSYTKKYYEIDQEYEDGRQKLIEFKGWLTGLSLREDIDKIKIEQLVYLSIIMMDAISYQLKILAHLKLNVEKPNQEYYRASYNDAKRNIDSFKQNNLKFFKKIEEFIEEFEKNEKTKT